MILLKIKQAECALADGRLEEALDLAKLPAVRGHRYGQRLIGRLTAAYLERGGSHLAAGRPRDALADCAKAQNLAGNTLDVAALRTEAVRAIDASHPQSVGAHVPGEADRSLPLYPSPASSEPHRGADGQQPMPETFVMQIDGVGSFLVTTLDQVTLGPMRASAPPDVAFIADPGIPPLRISRDEEDYFVESPTRALLSDGAKIALSPRCRLRFRRPNPASTSAVLELNGARLAACDARRVILLDRELIIGPSASAHITAAGLARPIVLRWHDGRLTCASHHRCAIDGKPQAAPADLPLNARITVGPVSLTLTKVGAT